MLTENGSLQLQDFTDRNFQEAFTQVTEGVWHVSGLGHSNAVVLEGNTGVILIDTLDTLERGEKLLHFIREKTGKEVKTVIFTQALFWEALRRLLPSRRKHRPWRARNCCSRFRTDGEAGSSVIPLRTKKIFPRESAGARESYMGSTAPLPRRQRFIRRTA